MNNNDLDTCYHTTVTEQDLLDSFVDEFGVLYSSDGKRLLRGAIISKYTIKKGTIIICDDAFNEIDKERHERVGDNDHDGEYMSFFEGNRLEEIEIPESVEAIGDYTFYGCKSLKRVSFPNSLKAIGDSAFSWCESLKEIIIPDSVNSIGEKAFCDCISLFSVILPKELSIISNEVFYRCCSLNKVILPVLLKEIGFNAFGRCSSLFLNIPKSVVRIKGDIGCSFEINKESPYLTIEDGVLYNSQKDTIHAFLCDYMNGHFKGNLPTWAIKKSRRIQIVTGDNDEIGWPKVFEKWIEMIDISIPKTIKHINEYAFFNKGYIESLSIPNSVKSIGECAFYNNEGLERVYLPNSLASYDLDDYFNDSPKVIVPIEVSDKIDNHLLINNRSSIEYDFETWLSNHADLLCFSSEDLKEYINYMKMNYGYVPLLRIKDLIDNLIQIRKSTIDNIKIVMKDYEHNAASMIPIMFNKETIDDILYLLRNNLSSLKTIAICFNELDSCK